MSYTTFKYSNLKLIEGGDGIVTAQFELANTGSRDGAEVAQLYIHQDNPSLPRPEKELKGFKKVFLKAGETQTVSIPLTRHAFAFYRSCTEGAGSRKKTALKFQSAVLLATMPCKASFASRKPFLKRTILHSHDDWQKIVCVHERVVWGRSQSVLAATMASGAMLSPVVADLHRYPFFIRAKKILFTPALT